MRGLLFFAFFFALAASAPAYDVSIVGKPYLQTMLMPSIEFSGASMQLTVKVKVLDDDGEPASGVVVRVFAQSGASLARLRGYGSTDSAGTAIVVTAFDAPVVSSKKVVLTACTEPENDCGKTTAFDLRRRWDGELETGYSRSAGTQVFYATTVPGGASVVSDQTQYEAAARLVFNLHSGGSLSHTNQFSAFVEGGATVLHSSALVGGVEYGNVTGFGPGGLIYGEQVQSSFLGSSATTNLYPDVAFGLQGLAWSRLYGTVSFSPAIGGEPGDLHAQAAWVQPIGRWGAVGGFTTDQPRSGNSNVYGAASGPLFGLAYSPKRSAALSILALGAWESAGRSQFTDSSGTLWSVPATRSPSVQLSVNYYRGGIAYVSFDIAAQSLTTSARTFSAGTTITLRSFLRRAPK